MENKISALGKTALDSTYRELHSLFKKRDDEANSELTLMAAETSYTPSKFMREAFEEPADKVAHITVMEVLKAYQKDYHLDDLDRIKETYLGEEKGRARKIIEEGLKTVKFSELSQYISDLEMGKNIPGGGRNGGAGS